MDSAAAVDLMMAMLVTTTTTTDKKTSDLPSWNYIFCTESTTWVAMNSFDLYDPPMVFWWPVDGMDASAAVHHPSYCSILPVAIELLDYAI